VHTKYLMGPLMSPMILKQLAARFRAFRADEDGAATVDFVVLTSFLVSMGLAHVKDIADGTTDVAGAIDDCLTGDITAILDGDPEDLVANLEAAGAACSTR